MAKFTKSVRFGLAPWLWRRLRIQAQEQEVSVSELVRAAVEKHLGELTLQKVEARQAEVKLPKPSLLHTPVVRWTPEEEQAAHRAMQLFINHDE
jgi:hypothetical protein